AAASSALHLGAIALRRFLKSGRQLQLETALSEATFASEDLGELAGPDVVSSLLEQALDLPSTCTAAPSVYSVLVPPQAH
ncbi:MAG TPA: hypothetical protein VKS25_09070, partial [Solirubrobacteraceae bacterium]|nr:hypothetical protein [Solirubrobacteraceae bacterium]